MRLHRSGTWPSRSASPCAGGAGRCGRRSGRARPPRRSPTPPTSYRFCSPMSHGHHSRGSSTSSHRSTCETPGGRVTALRASCASPAKLCGVRVPVTETSLISGVVLRMAARHRTRAELRSRSTYGVTLRSSTYRSRLERSCTSFQMPPGLRVGSLQSQLMPSSAPFTKSRFTVGASTLTTSRFSPGRIQREASNEKRWKNPSWEPR